MTERQLMAATSGVAWGCYSTTNFNGNSIDALPSLPAAPLRCSTTKAPRTAPKPWLMKSRCAPRRSCPAFLSPRPSPPSPPPWKAWKTGWPLIQDVTSPQRPVSRTATQPRLLCLRSQGTSTTSEDSRFVVCRNITGM